MGPVSMVKDEAWDQLLAGVTKPARYTDAEWNSIYRPDKRPALRFALAYPDVYEVGMSHLGLRILYHVLNDHPDYVAERVFLPWLDLEQALRARAQPLRSLESGTPLAEFDVVGINLPYELTYSNVLNLLDLGGIPLRAADRGEQMPVVLAGGTGAANPEPLAPFVDAFFVGEAEEGITEVAAALAASRGAPRAERLAGLAQVAGVYVPALYREVPCEGLVCAAPRNGAPAQVHRRLVDLETAPYPICPVVPYIETVHDRVTLEVMRGCTRGCRFCQAGMTSRPVRERSVATAARLSRQAIDCTGYDEVSLLGYNSADYSHLAELIDALQAQHAGEMVGISLPSLRVDTFTAALAERLQAVRKPGLTFAPEAGTQRLREVINKNVTEQDLFTAAGAAFAAGWFHLKLYFMIGLPTETEEDVLGIVDLVRRLEAAGRQQLGKERRGRLRLAVSVNPFVPKAHTPFQWEGQLPVPELERRVGLLRRGLASKQISLSTNHTQASLLEAVLARGDRSLAPVLEAAWRLGCRFDAWGEQFRPERWQQAFAQQGMDPQQLACRALRVEQALPWDHICLGVSKEYLVRELAAAREGRSTPDCRFEECALCGACPEAGGAG